MSTTNENVLLAKSDELVSRPVAASTQPTRTYLTFAVQDEDPLNSLKLGVDAEYVVEILSAYTITYLPLMPDYVPGIFNMRGHIIPVMDIRLRLDKYYQGGEPLLVVLNHNGTQVGILVDAVDHIVSISDDQISPVPSQESQRFVSGMFTLIEEDDTNTIMVLDCEQLLAHE